MLSLPRTRGANFVKAMAAGPTGSCKSPSRQAGPAYPPARLSEFMNQRRISGHVMLFPPQSCMKRN